MTRSVTGGPSKLDPLRVGLGAEDAGGRELEDPTEQRAGLRVLADAFDNPNAVGLVAVPVDLHPNFFLGGGLERRAEVAEAFEDPCLPADVEIRTDDPVPTEDRKELFFRGRERIVVRLRHPVQEHLDVTAGGAAVVPFPSDGSPLRWHGLASLQNPGSCTGATSTKDLYPSPVRKPPNRRIQGGTQNPRRLAPWSS